MTYYWSVTTARQIPIRRRNVGSYTLHGYGSSHFGSSLGPSGPFVTPYCLCDLDGSALE